MTRSSKRAPIATSVPSIIDVAACKRVAAIRARLSGGPTDKRDALTRAFRELRKGGYFARQSFWCCASCGWAAMTDKQGKRAVFYHKQDADDLRERGQCYLAWSGNGFEIVATLLRYGLDVVWDGSPNTRILVSIIE